MQVEIEAGKLSLDIKNKKKSINLKGSHTLKISGSCMTEIELSTDIENPTPIENFVEKSGIYVAKKAGVVSIGGENVAVLAEGQFFEVNNLKDLGAIYGEDVPDDENFITVDIRTPMGQRLTYIKYFDEDWEFIEQINSENIYDYMDFDTSDFIHKINISGSRGVYLKDKLLSIVRASTIDIDAETNEYKPITPKDISYAVKSKGEKYFADKTEFENLKEKIEGLEAKLASISKE